ncbi:Retrotransposable element Tf2 protein type 1-like protein, partial [Dinothrombium tinctorium]
LKKLVIEAPVLEYFDPKREIKVSSDASCKGLGAVLLQKHADGWKPIAYASRSLTDAETRYAQIEKELLGILFSCTRFNQYLFGAKFQIETDHKPLISLFKKPLYDCPLRIQRMMIKLQAYDFNAHYVPGKFLHIADALSRDPEEKANDDVDKAVEAYVKLVVQVLPFTDERLKRIEKETQSDEELILLRKMILTGFPKYFNECPLSIQKFWKVKDELSVANGIIFRGKRVVIPQSLRSEMLRKIHEGHLGIEKCRRRGREVLYWPGFNKDISRMVESCDTCLKFSNNQQVEPLQPHEIPTRPWQKVGTDIFEYQNKKYVLVTDYYSLYPEVAMINSITSATVINALKSAFARYGVPDILMSDNGRQYTSVEFESFTKDWDIKHITSSPFYPRSNGLIESSVKMVKNMIKKCLDTNEDIYKALLAYRSTPLSNGLSPSQLMFNRRVKSTLPISHELLDVKNEDIVAKSIERKLKQKNYFDRKAKK